MDEDQKINFRTRIETEIAACQKDIERLEVAAQPVAPDKALGRITRMESLSDQGVSSASLQRLRERAYKLEQALAALERPNFGSCSACGQPISEERLMLLPESTRCVRCAS